MNRLPLLVLAVLVLGSAGFGLLQLSEVKKLTARATAWDSEREALQKRIWDLQKRNGELERLRPATTVAGVAVPSLDGPARGIELSRPDNADASDARFRGRNESGRFGAMMSSPEVIKLMAVQQKAALDSRYSSLFKQLQLSPADLEKFKDLLVEKQASVMDVMAAARSEGLSGRDSRDEIRQLVQDARTEVDNNIRATLGDAAFAQYQNYEATQPQRNVVSQLEQRLSYSATPLNDTQSQQLVQILANTARTPGNNGQRNAANAGMAPTIGAGGPGAVSFSGNVPITTAAINQAQGILNAQQLSALQSLQQEQQAAALLRQQMRTNFPNQNSGSAPSASGTSASSQTSGTPAP